MELCPVGRVSYRDKCVGPPGYFQGSYRIPFKGGWGWLLEGRLRVGRIRRRKSEPRQGPQTDSDY